MYKLLAIDLDGTLLNTHGEISETTKRIIDETTKRGVKVVLASGRTVDSIRNFAYDLNVSNYIIAGNGSIIYDLKNKNAIYENYIPKSKALNLINLCEDNSITYSVYTNKSIISKFLKYNVLYYYKDNMKRTANRKTNITLVQDVYNYVKNMEDEKVMKFLIADKTKSVFSALSRKFKDIKDIGILDVSHISRKIISDGSREIPLEYYYTEISQKNVDKWIALEILAKKLNIDLKDVAVFGDNANDIKMLENAGLGIAMKNSSPVVKEKAKLVTDFDNNHDGVVLMIEKILDAT